MTRAAPAPIITARVVVLSPLGGSGVTLILVDRWERRCRRRWRFRHRPSTPESAAPAGSCPQSSSLCTPLSAFVGWRERCSGCPSKSPGSRAGTSRSASREKKHQDGREQDQDDAQDDVFRGGSHHDQEDDEGDGAKADAYHHVTSLRLVFSRTVVHVCPAFRLDDDTGWFVTGSRESLPANLPPGRAKPRARGSRGAASTLPARSGANNAPGHSGGPAPTRL